jgi:hypothetical protein
MSGVIGNVRLINRRTQAYRLENFKKRCYYGSASRDCSCFEYRSVSWNALSTGESRGGLSNAKALCTCG